MYPSLPEISPDAFVWWVRAILWVARWWWTLLLAALILGGAGAVSHRLARG